MTKINQNTQQLPIGVFDSGVGGLTVLRALQQALPQESFIYLGDTARLPYGTKGPETVTRYSKQASNVLVERGIKLLVIACNTVSALALPALQAEYPNLPIIGVLEPGAQAAVAISKNKRIAVIATEATVNAGGYQKAILKLAPNAEVAVQSCGLFVPLAEEGFVSGPIVDAVAEHYLAPLLRQQNSDCLLLGCTHYPILLSSIRKVVNQEIAIVDSAQTTATKVNQLLKELNLYQHTNNHHSSTQFLVTDAPTRFARVAKYFLGNELAANQIELVDISPNSINKKFQFRLPSFLSIKRG